MRIGIIMDSAVDLPNEFIEKENITVMPVTIQIGSAVLADVRSEEATMGFLTGETGERAFEAVSTPYGVQDVHDLFLNKLVFDYDYVFCITTAASRSGIYDNAVQASYSILNDYKPIRAQAGNNTPFSLRVVDSQNVFPGPGVVVVEAARLRDAGEAPPKIRNSLEALVQNVHAYMVPRDLYYLRNRTRIRGDRSVSLFSAFMGTTLDIKPILHANRGETGPVAKVKGFDHAVEKMFGFVGNRVREGLLTPAVVLSYGGDLAEMRAMPGYTRLREVCGEHDVTVYETFMGLPGIVNVGKGALAVGFAAEHKKFE